MKNTLKQFALFNIALTTLKGHYFENINEKESFCWFEKNNGPILFMIIFLKNVSVYTEYTVKNVKNHNILLYL
jgi:hypothetical protein